jgi:hypothetical protein
MIDAIPRSVADSDPAEHPPTMSMMIPSKPFSVSDRGPIQDRLAPMSAQRLLTDMSILRPRCALNALEVHDMHTMIRCECIERLFGP